MSRRLKIMFVCSACILTVHAKGDANQVTAESVSNPNSLQYNILNDVSGREFKAGDAEGNSSSGQQAAMATGGALMGAAIPMLASIFPPVRAEGAELMRRAIMEFAQAGADNSAGRDNGGQRMLLTNGLAADGSSPGQFQQDLMSQIQTPELREFLASRGVDSGNFATAVGTGQLQTVEDILAAVNDPGGVTGSDIFQGTQNAEASFGQIASQAMAQMPSSRSAGTAPDEGNQKTIAADDKGRKRAPASAEPGGSLAEGHHLLGKLFGQGQQGVEDKPFVLASLDAEALAGQGIKIERGGQNIFQLAHRHYRSFHKWRGSVNARR